MGLIRRYSEEGDPWGVSTLRGGMLRTRWRPALGRRGLPVSPRAFGPARMWPTRYAPTGGDPWGFGKFLKRAFKPPKAIRKLTFAKVGKALGNVARIAAPFVPGIGGLAGTVLSAVMPGSGGGGPEAPAPELVFAEQTGTVGQRARVDETGYPVLDMEYPIEARASRLPRRYSQSRTLPVYEDEPDFTDYTTDYEDEFEDEYEDEEVF